MPSTSASILEMQEHENQCLEFDLMQGEQDRVAKDREQERIEALQAEKVKLSEIVKEQEHQFEIEKEHAHAEYSERQSKLEHDLCMCEMEIEQKKQELELQKKLEDAAMHKAQLNQGIGGTGRVPHSIGKLESDHG